MLILQLLQSLPFFHTIPLIDVVGKIERQSFEELLSLIINAFTFLTFFRLFNYNVFLFISRYIDFDCCHVLRYQRHRAILYRSLYTECTFCLLRESRDD